MRDAKNDNIDSRAIASFLSFEYQKLVKDEFIINELKELAQQRNFLKIDSSKMKIKLKVYLDRVFHELESIVDVNCNAIRAILKEYPTAKAIANTKIDKLKSLASDASKGKYSLLKVELVKDKAKSSVGIDSDSIGLNIIQCIETLELKQRQIDSINTALTNHPLVINSSLHQKKGINSIEIAYIMSAIISIKQFDSPNKLVAYAGLDPKIRQSGAWQASRTRMSKRGNKLLRYALIWTAFNMTRRDDEMKRYYELKKSQDKSHYNALGHCAAILCRWIYWILNNPES